MEYFKQGLFVIILCLLLFPSLQRKYSLIRSKNLNGYFEFTPKPQFSLEGWIKGDFQAKYMKNREDSVGFRSDFIRLFNQVDYTLFSVPHAERVVIGKNNMLFTWNYMMSWLGKGLKGEKYIDEKVRELKFLQDDLWVRKKILLLVIFPPEKPYSYPGNLPDRYARQKRVMGNYQCYVQKCKEYGVNIIDVNHWFTLLKNRSPYLLFPNNGAHWSDYGAFIAADSTIRYMEKKMSRKLPQLVIDSMELTNTPRHYDNDIARTMNLIWDIKDPVLAYPRYHVNFDATTQKPSALFIGDSFYWGWDAQGLTDSIFRNKQFWYYDKEVYPESWTKTLNTWQVDLVKEVEKQDVIIIMHVGGGAGDMGSGFIDRAYAAFDTSSNNKIRNLENRILNSPEWMKQMEKKATENNIPIRQMVLIDAIYLANQELLKN
jgi:hypothetical protein